MRSPTLTVLLPLLLVLSLPFHSRYQFLFPPPSPSGWNKKHDAWVEETGLIKAADMVGVPPPETRPVRLTVRVVRLPGAGMQHAMRWSVGVGGVCVCQGGGVVGVLPPETRPVSVAVA